MEPASYKLLKSISALIFSIAIILYLSTHIVSIANRTYEVKNEEMKTIGLVSIPHDYSGSHFLFLSLMVLSGLQLWGVNHFGKRIMKIESELEFERTVKAEPVDRHQSI